MGGICYVGYTANWLDGLMKFVSLLGDSYIPLLITLVVAVTFWVYKYRGLAAVLVLAPLFGAFIKSVLKELIKRPRPIEFGCRAIVFPSEFSMPSGHVVFYTILFGLLIYFSIKIIWHSWLGKVITMFSILMIVLGGFSRYYLGAHFISDILVGYLVGGIILALSVYLIDKYQWLKR